MKAIKNTLLNPIGRSRPAEMFRSRFLKRNQDTSGSVIAPDDVWVTLSGNLLNKRDDALQIGRLGYAGDHRMVLALTANFKQANPAVGVKG